MVTVKYRNKRNSHKYIELKHYDDGHYYWRQHIHEDGSLYRELGIHCDHELINFMGDRRFRRVTKKTAYYVLEDYETCDLVDKPLRGTRWSYYL